MQTLHLLAQQRVHTDTTAAINTNPGVDTGTATDITIDTGTGTDVTRRRAGGFWEGAIQESRAEGIHCKRGLGITAVDKGDLLLLMLSGVNTCSSLLVSTSSFALSYLLQRLLGKHDIPESIEGKQ